MPTFTRTHYEPDLMPKAELVFDNFADMAQVLEATTRNEYGEGAKNSDYCVLVSREEKLYVLNFIYSEHCDRNNVVLMDRGEYEEEVFSRPLEGEQNDV